MLKYKYCLLRYQLTVSLSSHVQNNHILYVANNDKQHAQFFSLFRIQQISAHTSSVLTTSIFPNSSSWLNYTWILNAIWRLQCAACNLLPCTSVAPQYGPQTSCALVPSACPQYYRAAKGPWCGRNTRRSPPHRQTCSRWSPSSPMQTKRRADNLQT